MYRQVLCKYVKGKQNKILKFFQTKSKFGQGDCNEILSLTEYSTHSRNWDILAKLETTLTYISNYNISYLILLRKCYWGCMVYWKSPAYGRA